MSPAVAQRLRLLASALSVLAVAALAAAGWFYTRLRASLPQLDGAATVQGLAAPVQVERDALGVPTIRGQNRADVARGLGWLHAQDRFFQMDLLRRSSAGELAEIFGQRALPRDRANRRFGFRALAQKVVANLPAGERAVLDAYTAGVNAGLGALGARPFEYYVLRESPQPWRPEDSILVGYTMTLDLQDENGRYEKTLMTLRDQLGKEAFAFFAPLVGPDDAALDGSTSPLAPIPGPKVINLRAAKVSRDATPPVRPARPLPASFPFPGRDPETVPGSNAFALGGARTANGAGLLANDMHLDHGVPNIWYRASLEFPAQKITGVTLPGMPLVVAGSNGRVAWGFTYTYADTGDLVVVEPVPGLTSWYAAPNAQSVKYETRTETINVHGGKPVTVNYDWTLWGPVVDKDERERPLALHWVALDPAATNLGLLDMEAAGDVAAAIAVAHRAGVPTLNLVVADAAGNVAWTVAGRLPRRIGYDGRLPVSWTYGDRRWEGLLPPDEVPVIRHSASDPAPEQSIWSANQRPLGGEALTKIGDGGYARPARAAQIRDALAPLEKAAPRDLLKVQLDDRALFLAPWHRLLLDTLTPAAVAQNKSRAVLRSLAEKWEGRAGAEAVGYPIVKQFRTAVYERIFPALFAPCVEADPGFTWNQLQLEPAVWAMLRAKPMHLLDSRHASWDELLLAAADDVTAAFDRAGINPTRVPWGRQNAVHVRHPFSYSLPEWLVGWLNLPVEPLPGDVDLPRVQQPHHGASERLVVSPGHEAEGIFHMPGGQSGHPLSPFFRAGHAAWMRGEPTPFLPGKPAHTLRLQP